MCGSDGSDPKVDAAENRDIHVLARFDTGLKQPVPWSASGLYQTLKAFLAQAAQGLEGDDAEQLRRASTHWLRRNAGPHISTRTRNTGIASGLLSYGSSWIVIWALTVAPIAMVSALRETGIVFAVIIGIVFLKERVNPVRLASIALTLVGTTLLKLSR